MVKKADEVSSAPEPAASRALGQAPGPFKSLDVRTHTGDLSPSPVASPVVKQIPVRRLVSDGDVAAKRSQVQSDREKAASFRAERIPLLARLGQLDHHIDTYDRSVQEGAAAVVELRDRQRWEQGQARREEIAREARGNPPTRVKTTSTSSSQGHASPAPVAGPSRTRTASPRGAPWATSSPKRHFVGSIPKYKKDVGTDAQVERSRLREQCGYRGRGQRSQSRSRGPKPRGGHHHQFHHSSAGERNQHGDRVTHPAQDRGRRRAGAGQRARQQGFRSTVDSHGRSFQADSTLDWTGDELWEDEEGRE